MVVPYVTQSALVRQRALGDLTTGYGVQAQHLIPRFRALGHEVAHFAWYGLQGGMMKADGVTIYPAGYDSYGNDILPEHCAHFKADVFITLVDLWVMDPALGRRASEACDQWVPWVAYFPVDSSPPYPPILERIPHVDYPVQYSQFGLQQTAQAGAPECRFVPHGVDPTVFCPGDRAAARAMLGFPADAYVCAMVAANKGYPPRKAFGEQLQAFATFQRRHPEALLYLHSQTGEKMGGVDFDGICRTLKIPQSAVRMVDQYQQHIGVPEAAMAQVYRAADVLLAASYSEGFGVPILEAQATGTPVITTDGTSMTELTTNGIAVPSRQRFWGSVGGWWDTPDVAGIDAALETIYGWSPQHRAAESARGITWAADNFSWDVCVEQYWQPLLEEIERDIQAARASGRQAAAGPVAVPA